MTNTIKIESIHSKIGRKQSKTQVIKNIDETKIRTSKTNIDKFRQLINRAAQSFLVTHTTIHKKDYLHKIFSQFAIS